MEFRPFGGSDQEIRQVGTIFARQSRSAFVGAALADTVLQAQFARSSLHTVEHTSNVAGVTKGILLFAGVGVGAPPA